MPPSHDFLSGGGQLGALIRTVDWSSTELGPIEYWPQSLRTSVSICLASRFPIVLYWGPECIVLYNDAYSPILGSKHPWALGKRCCDCWAEIWQTIGPMLDSVMTGGQATWSDDLLLELKRFGYSEECYFSFSFSPIRIETGAIGGLFTAVMETTSRVIGERRLNSLRELAARIGEANSETGTLALAMEAVDRNRYDFSFAALYILDQKENHLDLKGCAGLAQGHALCGGKHDLRAPQSPFFRTIADVIRSGGMSLITDLEPYSLPPGIWGVPPVEVLALPVVLPGNTSPYGCLLVGLNARKRLDQDYRAFLEMVARQLGSNLAAARMHEEERKRADALAELDRAKTAFFSNVSHEFRTPLTLVVGPVEAMLDRPGNSVIIGKQDLQVMHRNILRLLKLVNALLDFSRIEAGRVQAVYEPTDLASLTGDIASAFRSAMEQAGLEFVIDCPPLPEPVYVDRDMWEKIVLNLISNAFKFTLAGKVTVKLRSLADSVELRVEDTGLGIAEQEQANVFQRFHRVEGVRGRTHEGTGIGLALVQELVRLQGGSIHVESTVGKGSTFIVSVPRGEAHRSAAGLGTPRLVKSTGASAPAYVDEVLSWLPQEEHKIEPPKVFASDSVQAPHLQTVTGRILLADDNADMRQYVRRLLGDYYDIHAVASGKEALGAVRRDLPDLVLTDVMMPELDGFGLLRELRANELTSTIPVILLSARAGEEARVEGMEAGADDYIVKPFTARELLARVSSHLALGRMRRQTLERERILRAELEIQVNERTADLRTANQELRELSWQLMRSQDEERRHVARELHDSAGQLLAVLSMEFASLMDEIRQKAPELSESMKQSNQLLEQLTREIRTTSYLLHPPLLDEVGLEGALSWYIQGLQQRSPLKIDLNISNDLGRLPKDMELVIFRVIQECLTNIHRHSGSEIAIIRMTRENDRIVLEVRDRGKGIRPEKLAEIASKGSGVGIRGMRERVRQFQGELDIKSTEEGTVVLMLIPLAKTLNASA
jgi:signal transduction histidine kinase